jgi:hypothetical protein
MPELERALRIVGGNLDYPAAPDLTGAVRRRLVAGERPRPPFLRRRSLVLALAVLAVAVGAAMAVPQARSTILDWFGIGNVTIRYVEELPSSKLATEDLGLGERMSLEEARRQAGFTVRVPTVDGLDHPPKVYWREDSVQVGFLYGSEQKPKLLITQAGVTGALQKLAGLGTEVELVNIEPGTAGIWLSGEKHGLFYPTGSPGHEEEPFRLVGNALIFETTGEVTIRLEAEISKDEAIRIARSMR